MAQTEGYVSEGDNTVTVILDTNLTPELVEEGFVPGAGEQDPDHEKRSRLRGHGPYLRVRRTTTIPSPASSRNMQTSSKSEVLADSITLGQMAGHAKEWNINGETVMLGVAKP